MSLLMMTCEDCLCDIGFVEISSMYGLPEVYCIKCAIKRGV